MGVEYVGGKETGEGLIEVLLGRATVYYDCHIEEENACLCLGLSRLSPVQSDSRSIQLSSCTCSGARRSSICSLRRKSWSANSNPGMTV